MIISSMYRMISQQFYNWQQFRGIIVLSGKVLGLIHLYPLYSAPLFLRKYKGKTMPLYSVGDHKNHDLGYQTGLE